MSIIKLGDKIKPFPAHIDREHFGWYLSGLVDGEGHFCLMIGNAIWGNGTPRRRMHARFHITLRDDDREIIELIHSYFGCGRINTKKEKKKDGSFHNPQLTLSVDVTGELVNMVIPHFSKHPLRAKKRKDYEVWIKGVAMLHEIHQRPPVKRPGCFGQFSKYSPAELAEFEALVDEIKKVRKYKPSPLPPAPPML